LTGDIFKLNATWVTLRKW